MKKEHYLNIFNYLLEFAKIRAKTVRDIIIQSNYYPDVIWLDEIPKVPYFNHALDNDEILRKGIWVSIEKPRTLEPTPPKLPIPDEYLSFVDTAALLKDNESFIRDSIIDEHGYEVSLNENPKLQEELIEFFNDEWVELKGKYFEEYLVYKEELEEYNHIMALWNKFFSMYNKIQQFGEEYELVLGCGLIQMKASDKNPQLRRHLFTCQVDIDFIHSKNTSRIIVRPVDENQVNIETDAILDLEDVLEIQGIIDSEKHIKELIQDNEQDYSFFSNNFWTLIEIFKSRIHPEGRSSDSLRPLNDFPDSPVISYSPALLFRKRNTRGLTTIYEQIIQDINVQDSIDIKILNDMIGYESDSEYLNDKEFKFNTDINNTLFFPKVYNDEQVQIVQNAIFSDKTLVQGPPGTGKSHTIANLICHLLANGNKILISAYTKRALEVLKEKLPKEIKPLCVELLGNDSFSIQGLKKSVGGINEKLTGYIYNQYRQDITNFSEKLRKNREAQSKSKRQLLELKDENSQLTLNPKYSGSPTELAQRIIEEFDQYDWYQDQFNSYDDEKSISDLKTYSRIYNKLIDVDPKPDEWDLPDLNNLISPEEFEEYCHYYNLYYNEYSKESTHEVIDYEDLNQVKELLNDYLEAINRPFDNSLPFKDNIIQESNHKTWHKMLLESDEIIDSINKKSIKRIEKEIDININVNFGIKRLINDAKILLNYLRKGNSLKGILFQVKKPFLQSEVAKRLYFIDSILINGSPPATEEDFQLVVTYLETQRAFGELEDIWGLSPNSTSKLTSIYEYYLSFNINTRKILDEINKIKSIEEQLMSCSSIELDYRFTNSEDVRTLIGELEYNRLLKIVQSFEYRCELTEEEIGKPNLHTEIFERLYHSFKKHRIEDYKATLDQILDLKILKDEYAQIPALLTECEANFPVILKEVSEGEFDTGNLMFIEAAIYHYHAWLEIRHYNDENTEIKLTSKLQNLEREDSLLLENLAASKSWFAVIDRLKNNRDLKMNLQAWVNAVEKTPKSGKRALKKRKIAQQYMEKCKEAIPCWIMPVFKVAESIIPKPGMFDYVIIDEASQLGPDAIFLMYIAKKIIIVGDDKQTSPEYVGISAEMMTPHISRHLASIPFNDHYGTDYSFFDHAKLFCNGMIVLREHFRCMPEIIEFSNKHFYAPENKALYPLKQYSDDRLKPLVNNYSSSGFTSGKGANITNEVEADEIVLKIKFLIKDSKYRGKTFGIICLQGIQQAALIEGKLLKAIGDVEYSKRRIICGNSASFQGDERDVMFLSLVTARNHDRRALTKRQDEQRFNVAMSRATEQVWLFHSVLINELVNRNDLRYKLLDHFTNIKHDDTPVSTVISRVRGKQPEPFDSWFEVDVYNDIVKQGFSVIPQYEVANGKYRIDLAIILKNGIKIAVECDGDQFHGPEQYAHDMARQKILERVGWQFFRVRGSYYYMDSVEAMNPLWSIIELNELSEEIYEDEDISSINSDIFDVENIEDKNEEIEEAILHEKKISILDSNESDLEEENNEDKADSTYLAQGKLLTDEETTNDIRFIVNKEEQITVSHGSIVTLKNLANNTRLKIQLVSDKNKIDLSLGSEIKIIHYKSPIGVASMDKKIGDRLNVENINIQYEIEEIVKP